jgi:ABC-2 type transport system permease protein
LWSKFLFAFLAALVVTLPLILVSDYMLSLSPAALGHHAVATLFICLGVSGLSVGMGAIYPNWREENPSKIVSGLGGTLNLLLSIAFVALVVILTALPYALEPLFPGWARYGLAAALAGTVLAGLLAGLVPMYLGRLALEKLEF